MLAKLNKIKPWQAALIIAVIGFAVFFTGLASPFQGDDMGQIVDNVPVHSITNIRLFFEGSTFYDYKGLAPLIGVYYRPLMTTVFSLIYSVFGPHPVFFHIFQLLIYIASAVLLYLVFRYSFKPILALILALIFLVHPLNSQVVYSIACMQDVLFFFFGILALWLLLRFKSLSSLLGVASCLLLSLLSKEMGAVFIIMCLLYLIWFNRERIYAFIGILTLPGVIYMLLRTNAIGIFHPEVIAPIDKLNLTERLFTAPSILLFYITKFVFPWKLATAYDWTYRTFSLGHVLILFLIDLIVIGCFIYLGFLIRKKTSKANYYTYLFFATWSAIGLVPFLQIVPLDFTACETWFYFSMAGLLGMIGVMLGTFRIRPNVLIIVVAILIAIFGIRTGLRGLDYGSQYTLAKSDISASPDDYNAYRIIALEYFNQSDYSEAVYYASRSVSIYPSYTGYEYLGGSLTREGNYAQAVKELNIGLRYIKVNSLYEQRGELTLVYGGYAPDRMFLQNALNKYPQDSLLWEYLAILEDKNNDNSDAKLAISNAAQYGPIPEVLSQDIDNNKSFNAVMPNMGETIEIP